MHHEICTWALLVRNTEILQGIGISSDHTLAATIYKYTQKNEAQAQVACHFSQQEADIS